MQLPGKLYFATKFIVLNFSIIIECSVLSNSANVKYKTILSSIKGSVYKNTKQ